MEVNHVPRVLLPSALRPLAGGERSCEAPGTTVGEVIRALETEHPALTARVVDEQGRLRPHVNVFVGGERASVDTPLDPDAEVQVLQSISGGADDAEVLVGTYKGLFVLRGPRGGAMDVAARVFEGQAVEFAIRDARTGTYYAAVTHSHFGPRVFLADDPAGDWEPSDGPLFPEDAGASVERVWTVQPGEAEGVVYAGVAPAALFRSDDGGRTWALNRGLWDHPSRSKWEPGFGGLCLHSICPWPGDPSRLAIGISAAGVWLTEDEGATWRRGVEGIVPRYLPEGARDDAIDLCVHDIQRCTQVPERIYMQFHGGVYRSDDAGEVWNPIVTGLPSDFGFPMITDPARPDRAYVIPLASDGDRVTPDGALRVYRTDDCGANWSALAEGLPQTDAYMTILRQAFGHDGRDPLGLWFGTRSGEVFGSGDGGDTWATAASRLPPVLSVRAS